MKIGFRTPSLKRSIKARTTGKLKRSIKRAINPFYEKKGVGLITNPKKALYNKVYKKTTFGISDIVSSNKTNKKTTPTSSKRMYNNSSKEKNKWIALVLCIFLGFFGVHKFYEGKREIGILYIFTLGIFGLGWLCDIVSLFFKPNSYYV